MKILGVSLLFTALVFASGMTVEDAWNSYKENPVKPANPSWVKPIPDFETFKRQWDEAKAFNGKYATTEEAWTGHKVSTRSLFFKISIQVFTF